MNQQSYPRANPVSARTRSLSLNEDKDEELPQDVFLAANLLKPNPRRRLNTYIAGMPGQLSLEEASDEDESDNAFSESFSGSLTVGKRVSLIAKTELSFLNFLQRHPSYELMPSSSKLVVFDTRLCGRKAFLAM